MRNLLIFCLFINVSALQAQTYLMDNTPVTTCSGTFYDSGNSAGNYTNSENYTKTFTPSTAGNMLQFIFTSFNTESCCDYVRIFDGPTTASPLIGQYQGATSPGTITATNPTGQLTFQWYSDGSIINSGWAASISCVAPPAAYLISTMGNVNTCSGFFFDSGGATGNYNNNENYTRTFCSGTTDAIRFTFTSTNISANDHLFIYNGPNTASPLIADITNTTINNTYTSTGTCLTFRFTSDNTVVNSGWVANISCTPPPPPNDDCSGAIPLSVVSSCSYQTYTTALASASSGVPAPGCANYQGGDVWFSAVVPASGGLMIDNQTGVITDGGMAIYSGTCGALTLIECDDDDSPNGLMPMISASGLTPGSTIYIRVWEFGNDNNGTFGICASTLCSAPTSISASSTPAGAIQTPTSVTFNYSSHTGGVCTGNWEYQWETSGGTVLQLWSTTSSYTTTVSSTVSYVLRMRCSSCPSSTTLSNIITIYYGVVPLNDECSGAIPVTVNPSSNCVSSTPGTINLATASPQANDCWGTANDDVWYSFIATSSTHYILLTNIVGSTTDLYHSVYAGNCGSIGTPLICSDPESSTITGLTIGNTYYVRVFSWSSSSGQTTTFDICINSPGPPTSGQDCLMGTTICNDQQFSGNSNDFGYQELTSANQGCLSDENQTSWYLFSPQTQGTIELSITPQNWADDYDFAIWGPYPPGSTAADICPPSVSPLRCSWSAWDGNTGLMSGAGDVSEGAGGDKWVDPIIIGPAQIDAVYLMLIDNWTETYTPFTLDWTLTGVILDCTVLPVVLVKSFAECRENGTNIQWTTASEQNNDQFMLYRSVDNKNFTFIGSVQGSGNSNQQKTYQFSDNLSYEGEVYYKLDQIDFDGVTSQLTIMAVNCTHISGFDLQSAYFDNYEEYLFVYFSGIADKQYELKLHDLTGKVLLNQKIIADNSGHNNVKFPVSKLQQSLYIVSMTNEIGISKYCKVFAK